MTEARLWAAQRAGVGSSGPFSFARRHLATVRGGLPPHAAGLIVLALAVSPILGMMVAGGQGAVALVLALAVPVAILLLTRPFVAILLWLLVMPYFITAEPTGLNIVFVWLGHRLLIPAMLLVVTVYHWTGYRRSEFRVTWIDVVLAAFLVLGVANVLLFSEQQQRMLVAFIDRLCVPIFLFWLIRAVGLTGRDQRSLAIVAIITVLAQSLVGYLSWVAPGVLPSDWLGRQGDRTVGTVGGPAPFTATIVFFSLILVHWLRTSPSRASRGLIYVTVAAGAIAVFLSLSRGSWLGALAVALGLALLYPRLAVRLAPFVAVAAFVLLLSPLGSQVSTAEERVGDADTVVSRMFTTDAAIQMIADRPLEGFGYGNFELFDERFKRSIEGAGQRAGGSSHHTYIALAAENGLPALVLYLLPVAGLGFWSIRAWPRLRSVGPMDRGWLAILWLAMLDQFLVSNFMDMLHSSSWATGLWWLTLGLIALVVIPGRNPVRT